MKVLYLEPVLYNSLREPLNVIIFCVVLAFLIIFDILVTTNLRNEGIGTVITLLVVIIFVGWITMIGKDGTIGGYKYYVTFNDMSSLEEYLDEFKLVETKGELYILEKDISKIDIDKNDNKKKAIDDSQLGLPGYY